MWTPKYRRSVLVGPIAKRHQPVFLFGPTANFWADSSVLDCKDALVISHTAISEYSLFIRSSILPSPAGFCNS
jgi:hypothetical protein